MRLARPAAWTRDGCAQGAGQTLLQDQQSWCGAACAQALGHRRLLPLPNPVRERGCHRAMGALAADIRPPPLARQVLPLLFLPGRPWMAAGSLRRLAACAPHQEALCWQLRILPRKTTQAMSARLGAGGHVSQPEAGRWRHLAGRQGERVVLAFSQALFRRMALAPGCAARLKSLAAREKDALTALHWCRVGWKAVVDYQQEVTDAAFQHPAPSHPRMVEADE